MHGTKYYPFVITVIHSFIRSGTYFFLGPFHRRLNFVGFVFGCVPVFSGFDLFVFVFVGTSTASRRCGRAGAMILNWHERGTSASGRVSNTFTRLGISNGSSRLFDGGVPPHHVRGPKRLL